MDVHRPELGRRKQLKQRLAIAALLAAALIVGLFFIFYTPGPYEVDRDLVFRGKVERGEMRHELHGVGSLEPEEVRWISAQSAGRVERIHVLPGAEVEPQSLILELSNSELLQQQQQAELQLLTDEANFLVRKAELQSSLLSSRSALSRTETEFKQAELDAQIDKQLFERGLESEQASLRSSLRSARLAEELKLEKQRYQLSAESIDAQVKAEQAKLEQSQARLALLNEQVDALQVKAGFSGLLQQLELKAGQQVSVGQALAQVVNPKSLKASVRIDEHQAKRLSLGLNAEVDTRGGKLAGSVSRIDPNVEAGTVEVDISFIEALPPGLRPNASVEATIEVQRISDVAFVSRPAYARADSKVRVFRFVKGSNIAEQVKVSFGRSSVNSIEIVEGLQPGDEIILSDSSSWLQHQQIKLN
ncbi:efflux RND transporter periplasmic adaptor subunit [Agaribacterium haliotis]|uniref:efflux RND transporter periplasmic adaptor subunit n=1 Tax=Agaribacterium haliotis TaxID=2013869 RepID=UPI000BB56A50|nr:efflux RND transporter periplasmic adaptor subunit [Agaribacterium haliotis]